MKAIKMGCLVMLVAVSLWGCSSGGAEGGAQADVTQVHPGLCGGTGESERPIAQQECFKNNGEWKEGQCAPLPADSDSVAATFDRQVVEASVGAGYFPSDYRTGDTLDISMNGIELLIPTENGSVAVKSYDVAKLKTMHSLEGNQTWVAVNGHVTVEEIQFDPAQGAAGCAGPDYIGYVKVKVDVDGTVRDTHTSPNGAVVYSDTQSAVSLHGEFLTLIQGNMNCMIVD